MLDKETIVKFLDSERELIRSIEMVSNELVDFRYHTLVIALRDTDGKKLDISGTDQSFLRDFPSLGIRRILSVNLDPEATGYTLYIKVQHTYSTTSDISLKGVGDGLWHNIYRLAMETLMEREGHVCQSEKLQS